MEKIPEAEYKTKDFELEKGKFLATCEYIRAAMRLIMILGEPAEKIAYLSAKIVDYYMSSPEEAANRAHNEIIDRETKALNEKTLDLIKQYIIQFRP